MLSYENRKEKYQFFGLAYSPLSLHLSYGINNKMFKNILGKFILWCVSLALLGLLFAVILIIGVFHHYSQGLPDHTFLKDYEPPVVTRVHAGDGRLLAEFAQEQRIYVPIEEIPDLVKNAFIAAEDKNFYKHSGIDFKAVMRAVLINLKNYGSEKRMVGASTISQQVAKNFLLTNEQSFERKIREALIAYRMDKALSKDRILELYLNEIFLGNRSYGVGAAGLNYFNKPLDKLTISEAAYLAALPKAPNNYHPVRHYDKALTRRNWVLDRMEEESFIIKGEAALAKATPLQTRKRSTQHIVEASYFSEEIRRKMIESYGEDSIYKQGLSIRTSLDPLYQDLAMEALRNGLQAYDRRHGWKGALRKNSDATDFLNVPIQKGMLDHWELALVKNKSGKIETQDGGKGEIRSDDIEWAKATSPLKSGDVVIVESLEHNIYALHQVPKIQGAIIVMDPHTGRVLAMQGGWTFDNSEYNRATQAYRQPGSAFKPFVYLAALEEGLTPSTRILDAPFEYEDRPGHIWSPKNYANNYYGPTPLRVGIEKSKNLMTVRLAHYIGMEKVVETATRFGVTPDLKPHLANSLGSAESTLLKMTSGYAMFVNGGKKIAPTFIDRIQNRYGETIFQHDNRPCSACGGLTQWNFQPVPDIPDQRPPVSNPQNVYQIVSILEGVVERGTARRLASLNRPLAGKTGTTNESRDAWFIGFSPDLVVGVYTGFDQPATLGKKETGSSLAVPIFKSFMEEALKDTPATPFRVPEGMRQIRVNPKTGQRVSPLDENGIWEAFIPGTNPESSAFIIDGNTAQSYGTPYLEDYIESQNGEVFEPYGNERTSPYAPSYEPYAPQQPLPTKRLYPKETERNNPTGTGGLY